MAFVQVSGQASKVQACAEQVVVVATLWDGDPLNHVAGQIHNADLRRVIP